MANRQNFATGTVLTAPSPALSGTTLVLHAGEGDDFPAVPFYVTAHVDGQVPTNYASEVLLVTAKTSDTLTFTRAQKNTGAVSIAVNWRISNGIYVEDIPGQGPVIYVAASDAPSSWLGNAQYVCTGTADNTTIASAVTESKSTGNPIYFSPGNFAIAATVNIQGTNDPDTGPVIGLHGVGAYQTTFNCANNVDGFKLYDCVKVNMSNMQFGVAGSGAGIASVASASANRRSFWLSSFKNIQVLGPFDGTHTGFAFRLGSPFRSTFENLEASGTLHGIKMYSEYSDFNPGDCTFTRCFMEIIGAGGIAYNINGPTGKGLMNQMTFNMCEGIANSGTSTGILVDGAVGGTWNRFYGTNLEQFATIVDVTTGEGNEFNCNYVEATSGGTIFRTRANAQNNVFRGVYCYSASTQTIFNDANTVNTFCPNRMEFTKILADSGATMSLSILPMTVLYGNVSEGVGTMPNAFYDDAMTTIQRNKRFQVRSVSTTSASSLTPALSTANFYIYTALAAGLTINVPSGTPVNGETLMFRFKDNATARALTWNAIYRTMNVALPTTTVISKTHYIEFIYNAADTKWDAIRVIQQT